MKLFLDTSVLPAASGSDRSLSRALLECWLHQQREALASPYVVEDVHRNVGKLDIAAFHYWRKLLPRLKSVPDCVTFDRPVVFEASKDRPVLLTAFLWADVLLTLDMKDFGPILGRHFYGLEVLTPHDFVRKYEVSLEGY